MTHTQRLQIEASEKRQAARALLDRGELAAEERAQLDTLTKRLQELEPELRAAVLLDGPADAPADSPEGRELRGLVDGASVGRIMASTIEHRATSGAEAELQAALGLNANDVPLALLRTRAVTPAPSNVGTDQQPIIPMVFPDSVAAFLGVDMPVVGVGEAVFPVLTAGAVPQTPAENTATNPTDDTGAFDAEVLKPSRLQTSLLYSREDRARFAGMDSALRENLSMALADGLDKQIVAGTNGLLTGTNLANNNVNAVTTYALYREQFAYGRVDGKYAVATGDLRVVMGSATFVHAASQYRGNNDNTDALMALGAAGIPVRVSAHVPAVASSKQNAIVRLGMRHDATAAVWEGVSLIPDEITKAAEGQIRVTAVMMFAVQVLRQAGFHKQQTQHA